MSSNLTVFERLLPVIKQIHEDLYKNNNMGLYPRTTVAPVNATQSTGADSGGYMPLVYVLVVVAYYTGIIFICMIGCGVYKKVSGYHLYEKFVERKEIKEQRRKLKEARREELKRMSSRNSEEDELVARTQESPSVASNIFFDVVPNGSIDWDGTGQVDIRKNHSCPGTLFAQGQLAAAARPTGGAPVTIDM